MPSFCAVLNCEQKYIHEERVSFHRFPKDEKLIQEWNTFTGRGPNWEPSRWSAICSRHFKPSDFRNLSLARKSLKRNAVPSISIYQPNDREQDAILMNYNESYMENEEFPDEGNQHIEEPIIEKVVEPNYKQDLKQHLIHHNPNCSVITNSKILDNLPPFNSNQLDKTQTTNTISNVKTICRTNDVYSIPLDLPLSIEQSSLIPTQDNMLQTVSVNTTSNYTNNQSLVSNLNINTGPVKIFAIDSASCRLCGHINQITNSFATDFEIFAVIQKCLPTLNIRQDDAFPKGICSICLESLENFSEFIDGIIKTQKIFEENFQQHFERLHNEKPSTVISDMKIKQEPTANLKVNIKQEISDVNYPPSSLLRYCKNTYDENSIPEQIQQPDPDDNHTENDDQKFHFHDCPTVNASEIIKNCDVMEIINLEDAYIDIADDEIDESVKTIESQPELLDNHPKVIENKEIKVQKKITKDVEPFPKYNIFDPSIYPYMMEDHNYSRLYDEFEENDFKFNSYKEEEPEDEPEESEELVLNGSASQENSNLIESLNTPQCISNEIIPNKIEIQYSESNGSIGPCLDSNNSPKKNISNRELNVESVNEGAFSIQLNENKLENSTQLSPPVMLESNDEQSESVLKNQSDVLLESTFEEPESDLKHLPNSKEVQKSQNFTTQINVLFAGNTIEECGITRKTCKPSSVVINESILNPVQPFDLQKCSICELQFFSKDDLAEHKKTHHLQTQIQDVKTSVAICTHFCVLCESNFDSFYDLLKHRNQCRVKNQMTVSNKTNKTLWNCSMCPKIFTSKLALNNHRKYICKYPQSKNTYDCKYCDEHFKKRMLCRKHEKECRKIQNEKNSERFNKRSKRLVRTSSKSSQNSQNIKSSGARYSCDICTRSYTLYHNLVRHKTFHRPKEEWNFQCGSCLQKFERMQELRKHINTCECPCVPSKPENILFVCTTCGKKFKTLEILKEHRITHSDQMPFNCQVCGKKFKAIRNLKQHRITHTDKKSHSCDMCDKSFKRLNGLVQHVKAFHLKLKPHVCPVCQHCYALKGDMLRCKHSLGY